MSLNFSDSLKADLSVFEALPDEKSGLLVDLVGHALGGKALLDADVVAASESIGCEVSETRAGVDALCFLVGRLVQLSTKEEVPPSLKFLHV